MEIKRIVEVLVTLAALVLILMYLPAAVFKFIVDALLVVWAVEIAVLLPVFAVILLKNPRAA